jgi:hypothetical protein
MTGQPRRAVLPAFLLETWTNVLEENAEDSFPLMEKHEIYDGECQDYAAMPKNST